MENSECNRNTKKVEVEIKIENKMKKLSILCLLVISIFSCKEKEGNTPSPEQTAKNEKIRSHFVVVTGELDKFMNAEKLDKGAAIKDDYLRSIPYALSYVKQMKEVGFTEYSDKDYRNAFSYALQQAITNQEEWKNLTYTLAAKANGDITKYNTTNQKNVDSLAYFQAGVDIISNEIYVSGVDLMGIAELQGILENIGIEKQYRTPINVLD